MMFTHAKAEYQMLIDNATNYMLRHAAGAGLSVLPPTWDDGAADKRSVIHKVRLATVDAGVNLRVPHEWLSPDSDGYGRFRTEVESALAQLKAMTQSAGTGRP
jgi:hypothetical protein